MFLKNPQKGLKFKYCANITNKELQCIATTGKDSTSTQHCEPLLPPTKGLLVELYRRAKKIKNVRTTQCLWRLWQYCTNDTIPPKALLSLALDYIAIWKQAKVAVDSCFPESMLVVHTVPAKVAAAEAQEVLRELTDVANLLLQAPSEDEIDQQEHTSIIQECEAMELDSRKRKRANKPLSTCSEKYQRRVARSLIEELSKRCKDSFDNIVTVMLSMNRPAAIKIALQVEGVADELSTTILEKLKFTPKEMVDLMVPTFMLN